MGNKHEIKEIMKLDLLYNATAVNFYGYGNKLYFLKKPPTFLLIYEPYNLSKIILIKLI